MAELLKTPLHGWHVAQGARLVDFAGHAMPVQYKSIVDEHLAVRTGVGLFDISHMARLIFNGPEAEAFLQHVFTNDVTTMKPGQVRYGLILNDAGCILDDVLVYKLPPGWLMVVNAGNHAKIVAWLQKHLPGRKVTMVDRTADLAMIALQGPKALAATAEIEPKCGELKYYFCTAGIDPASPGPRLVSRTGYTGEDGFEIIAPNQDIEMMVGFLTSPAIAARIGSPVVPCGLGARDTLRLEAAMPLYGHELSEQIDPLQAGLDWAVKLEKPDFIGKAALLDRRRDANRSVRIGLELDGKRAAREGYPILKDGQPVGTVTSGAFTPTLQKAIAMGYVPPALAAIGSTLAVDIRGQASPARVVKLPFYSRKK